VKVSVVVPTRGGAARLSSLLAALRAQGHADWEAVVVIDGDVDGSADVLAREAVGMPVHTVVLPENRGRSTALNTGFAAATGDVLLRCDDDLVPGPDHLARHAAHHEGPPVGVVGLYANVLPPGPYADVYGTDADARLRGGAYAAAPGATWRYWAGYASVTAETFRRVGDYDLRYRAYGWEDADWGYRLHRLGVPVVVDPRLEVPHLAASASTAARAQRAFYSGAARRTFEELHAADLAWQQVLPPPDAGRGVWGAAVRGVARVLDERRVVGAGRLADRALGFLPRAVGHKGVALLVEAAALSGHRAGQTRGAI
jgi:glycosyltransferase involved in cell wall biosynthesis